MRFSTHSPLGLRCHLPCCLEAAARPPVASTLGLGVWPDTLCDITKGSLPEWHALFQISFKNGQMDFSHSLNHNHGLQTQFAGAVVQFSICLNCVFGNTSRARKGEDHVDSVTEIFVNWGTMCLGRLTVQFCNVCV